MNKTFSIKKLFEPSVPYFRQQIDHCIKEFTEQKDEVNSFNKEELDNIFSTLIIPETPASIESYIDNVKNTIIPIWSH